MDALAPRTAPLRRRRDHTTEDLDVTQIVQEQPTERVPRRQNKAGNADQLPEDGASVPRWYGRQTQGRAERNRPASPM